LLKARVRRRHRPSNQISLTTRQLQRRHSSPAGAIAVKHASSNFEGAEPNDCVAASPFRLQFTILSRIGSHTHIWRSLEDGNLAEGRLRLARLYRNGTAATFFPLACGQFADDRARPKCHHQRGCSRRPSFREYGDQVRGIYGFQVLYASDYMLLPLLLTLSPELLALCPRGVVRDCRLA
jgi:hypothetical protein